LLKSVKVRPYKIFIIDAVGVRMQSFVLVINCGSSSLKFALINPVTEEQILAGLAERLGQQEASITLKHAEQKITAPMPNSGHSEVLQYIVSYLTQHHLHTLVSAVGHRVVHGGEQFKHSVVLTADVIKAIKACEHLAPLHNPANLIGIQAALAAFPTLTHVAVFDTAFHQSLPQEAYLYAVPMAWYREHGVRRYGFHGTSHRYVSEKAAHILNLPIKNSAFICAHLGNGASATAILNGKSVDTSMGLTPLEGLVMGTRSGDVDPGLHAFIAEAAQLTIVQVNEVLNKESGLFGLSELSNDCRELEEAASQGHQGAIIALEVFAFRLAKYIAALAISLPRIDALIFTGGIGENSSYVRAKVLARLQILGFAVEDTLNTNCIRGKTGIISKANTPIAMVVNTNEEVMIARDTVALVQ
jgi:acetate kinase